MSVNLLAPDLRRILTDLGRRLDVLERRVSPTAPPAAPPTPVTHTHDGTGADSTAVAGASVTSPPVASGDGATAVGAGASAQGENSVAVGIGADAFYENSIAIGFSAVCTAANQVQLGNDGYWGADTMRVVLSVPPTAITSAHLSNSHMSFYLDESGNTLTVKVKYSSGTVKTGTVALT